MTYRGGKKPKLSLNMGIKLAARGTWTGLIYFGEMTFADTNNCNTLAGEDGWHWGTGKGHSKQALTLQDSGSQDDTAEPLQ